jgi:hypothetical protein
LRQLFSLLKWKHKVFHWIFFFYIIFLGHFHFTIFHFFLHNFQGRDIVTLYSLSLTMEVTLMPWACNKHVVWINIQRLLLSLSNEWMKIPRELRVLRQTLRTTSWRLSSQQKFLSKLYNEEYNVTTQQNSNSMLLCKAFYMVAKLKYKKKRENLLKTFYIKKIAWVTSLETNFHQNYFN